MLDDNIQRIVDVFGGDGEVLHMYRVDEEMTMHDAMQIEHELLEEEE